MSGSTQLIELGQARAGMVLAGDLKDANGGVLLPDGATLSDANLNSLRRRGIEHCNVVLEADDAVEDPAARGLRLERQRLRLALLFRASGDDAGALLLQLLTTYRENG